MSKESTKDIFEGDKIQVWFDKNNSLYCMYFIDRGTTFCFHYLSMFSDLNNCLNAWNKNSEYTGDHVSIIKYKNEDAKDIELVFRYIGSITITENEIPQVKNELEQIVGIIMANDFKIAEKWK